jgi:hypothetical protein
MGTFPNSLLRTVEAVKQDKWISLLLLATYFGDPLTGHCSQSAVLRQCPEQVKSEQAWQNRSCDCCNLRQIVAVRSSNFEVAGKRSLFRANPNYRTRFGLNGEIVEELWLS